MHLLGHNYTEQTFMWDQLISLLSFHKINIKVLARLGSSEESGEESTPKLIQFIGIMLFWQLWD